MIIKLYTNEVGILVEEFQYRIVMWCKPAVRIDGEITLEFKNLQVKLHDIWDSEIQAPVGLRITSTVTGNNLDSAIDYVSKMVSGVVLLIGYISSVGIPPLFMEKVYEVTPGKKQGVFKSFQYELPLPIISQKAINREDFFTAMNETGKLSSSSFQRIFRALQWYNSGVLSENKIDKFTSLWISFENLNKILTEFYSIDEEVDSCSTCGRSSTTMLIGVKHLIESIHGDEDAWKRIRRTRVWIVHGTEGFSKILSEVENLTPIMERYLTYALDTLLQTKHKQSQATLPLSSPLSAITIVDAIIEGSDLGKIDSDIEPSIEIKIEELKPIMDESMKFPYRGTEIKMVPEIIVAPGYQMRITKVQQDVPKYIASEVTLFLNDPE